MLTYTWTNYTALIAEDDPLNRRYMELLLDRQSDIKLLWAKDGHEASDLLNNHVDIDIVLLDLQLPNKDGLTILKELRLQNSFLPVIIQTANTWNNEEEICLSAGCDGFFTKPLDMDGLLACMDKCLRGYAPHKYPLVEEE